MVNMLNELVPRTCIIKNVTLCRSMIPLWNKEKKSRTYDVTLFRELGNKPRWKTNSRSKGDIEVEAVHLKSPVAEILLANYEVIGKLSRRGTRLAALYLITSNKRYSCHCFFFLHFPALLFFLFSFVCPFCIFPFYPTSVFHRRIFSLSLFSLLSPPLLPPSPSLFLSLNVPLMFLLASY